MLSYIHPSGSFRACWFSAAQLLPIDENFQRLLQRKFVFFVGYTLIEHNCELVVFSSSNNTGDRLINQIVSCVNSKGGLAILSCVP